tara:strand:+ start:787 stop:1371 length:585 start_codon:yes stop_codon:yes gene_type:complete
MDDFQSFQQIFKFCLSTKLDSKYVHSVENTLNNKELIDTITDFHTMRADLCKLIIDHVGNVTFFQNFVEASLCLQYNSVPDKSTCVLSGVELSGQNGILIVIDSSKLFTFHKRLKVIVLTFWYLIHLPSELSKESINWFRENSGTSSTEHNVASIVDKISKHNNNMFVKRAYVKLLNTVKFVQKDMSQITVCRG